MNDLTDDQFSEATKNLVHVTAQSPMQGEGMLINLMHTRYVEGVMHMCSLLQGNVETETLVRIAKHLSTSNVNYYRERWKKEPDPVKVVRYVNSCWQVVDK